MNGGSNRKRFDEMIPITKPTLPPLEEYRLKLELIWKTGQITNGALVREIEALLEDYIGDTHCVAVANNTIGLILALKALDLKGAVILPSFTFFATAHSLIWNDLEPVFAEIDERTWNLSLASVRGFLEKRDDICAIMPVHVFGNPCQVTELEAMARTYGVKLVFDAAHALGSESSGRKTGGFGDAEVFSLSPTKPVVAGEGGIVSTSNGHLADILRYARDYGNDGDYDPSFIGLNARLSELHAALGLGSLGLLERGVKHRNEVASHYKQGLSKVPGIGFQEVRADDRSTFKDFTILVEPDEFGMSRDTLSSWLVQQRIDTRKYYFPPVHRTKAYWERWGMKLDGQLPVTNRISGKTLSLPIWSHMDIEIADRICEVIVSAFSKAEEINAKLEESAGH